MIQFEMDTRRVEEAFALLKARCADTTPARPELGEYLIESTKDRFRRKEAPDGTPWAPNSPLTIERKGRDDALVGESKRLGREFHYRLEGDDGLSFGSPLEYAAVQHFGAEQGEFGRSDRNTPIPWGDIPSREIIGLSADDEYTAIEIFADYLDPL